MSNKRQNTESPEITSALAVQNVNTSGPPEHEGPRPQFFPTLATGQDLDKNGGERCNSCVWLNMQNQ